MAIPYRKFRLQNANGTYFTLTEPTYKVFADDPTGLGFSKTLSTLRLGDDNLITYSLFNLDQIHFEILFYDDKLTDKYQKYNDFINFLSFKPIYLQYQKPNSFVWYRRQVEPLSLSKTQVQYKTSMLVCPLELLPLTFWEDDISNVVHTSNQIERGGKIYPITYPFAYGNVSLSNIPIVSNGMLATPLEITINGLVSNPQYIVYDENDVVYGRGKFNGTFDNIYINSDEANEQLILERGGLVLDNPLSYQDLTVGSPNEIYITFLKLKTGNSKLRFIVDGAFDGDVKIEWRNRYVTV